MANKKKGSGHQDTDEMSKSEIKEYHAEICEYLLENGFPATLAHFKLSAKQAAKITKKVRAKRDKEDAKSKVEKKASKAAAKAEKEGEKAEKRAARAAKKAAKAAKKKPPKKVKVKKAPKKVKAKKAPKKVKAKKAPKKVKAKKAPKAAISTRASGTPGRKAKADHPTSPAARAMALQLLLQYRKGCGTGKSLDEAIVEIAIDLS